MSRPFSPEGVAVMAAITHSPREMPRGFGTLRYRATGVGVRLSGA